MHQSSIYHHHHQPVVDGMGAWNHHHHHHHHGLGGIGGKHGQNRFGDMDFDNQSQMSGVSAAMKPHVENCCTVMLAVPRFFWHKIKESCLLPVSHAFLSSSWWRTCLVIGNFILLFGNPIQMLLIPKAADRVLDFLYTLVFFTFIVDMIARATAVAGYFRISAGRIYNPSKNYVTYCWQWIQSIRFPSFLFACDLFSTLTLLYDISFFTPSRFNLQEMDITLRGSLTLTSESLDIINRARPWELNTALMITVLKTARVVRFVRSQAVSTLISRVNWYWPLQRLDAFCSAVNCFYGRDGRMHSDHHDHYDSNGDGGPGSGGGPGGPNNSGGKDHHHPPGGRHHHHHNHREGRGGGDLSSSKTSNPPAGVEAYQDSRRLAKWRDAKAQLDAEEYNGNVEGEKNNKKKNNNSSSNNNQGIFGGIKKLLGGIFGKGPSEFKKEMAATKIQRAWRRYVIRRQNSSDHFRDELSGNSSMMKRGGAGSSVSWGATTTMGGGGGGGGSGTRNNKNSSGKKLIPKSLRKMSIYPGMDATKISARISQKLKYAAGGDSAAESQVGGAMRELTGQRVAIGILVALLLTATFTYVEQDATRPATMVILHAQTTGSTPEISPSGNITTPAVAPPRQWIETAVHVARRASVPDLYKFEVAGDTYDNETLVKFPEDEEDAEDLREREKLKIIINSVNSTDQSILTSVGWFANREERVNEALVQLMSTIFILLLWLFGVTAFAGPVMVLVVLPIERMVRLLGMLMVDPLGYQSTGKYRRFVAEEDELTKNTRWTKDVLKGMETSFLMSTILRIGSLMQVGFGSAGVEIIRKNLEKKQGGNVNLLTSKGLTVSCIFLFCDIRQFTDATECLQEEVFVFTNRIAAVVHSFCHSFGGSANKNVGDAFLCSWLLDTPPNDGGFGGGDQLYAKNNQADKCLLCVVKIVMALHHDNYYIETMSEAPRQRLLAKLKKRPGPVVQMGCGIHAGKAVQGAIGSERKIDATYVSEAVEMSEFLESSTKKYGLKMLMSNSFHNLLHSNNRQRCRLVDQIVMPTDEDVNDDDLAMMYERDDIIELYTYDMDVDALWKAPPASGKASDKSPMDAGSMSDADSRQGNSDRRGELKKVLSAQRTPGSTRLPRGRRMSITNMITSKSAITSSGTSSVQKTPLDGSVHDFIGTEHNSAAMKASGNPVSSLDPKESAPEFRKPELILPTGPAPYNPAYWRSDVMFRIRKKYLDGLFFHNYSQGLQSFYHRDWDRATQSFKAILDTFEDGPSRYFLNQIEKHDGKVPPNFRPYGIA